MAATAMTAVTVQASDLWKPSAGKEKPMLIAVQTVVPTAELVTIDPLLEHVMPNGVIIYGKPSAAEPLL